MNQSDRLSAGGRALAGAATFLGFASALAHPVCDRAVGARSFAAERAFAQDGSYSPVYALIENLPIYQQVRRSHVQMIARLPTRNPVVIDAGGGVGLMADMAQRARPDAQVHLVDLEPAMLAIARERGVAIPAERIHQMSVTEIGSRPPLGALSADHIFSHSVIWNLERPIEFFQAAWTALKPGGTLAVSTVVDLKGDPELFAGFIAYLGRWLLRAEQAGRVSAEQRHDFVESNRRLGDALKSPLSARQLAALGEEVGLRLVSTSPVYVVPTPSGPRPTFTMAVFRKP